MLHPLALGLKATVYCLMPSAITNAARAPKETASTAAAILHNRQLYAQCPSLLQTNDRSLGMCRAAAYGPSTVRCRGVVTLAAATTFTLKGEDRHPSVAT
jgi:hypothetical protein